jgi:hypothetical protein
VKAGERHCWFFCILQRFRRKGQVHENGNKEHDCCPILVAKSYQRLSIMLQLIIPDLSKSFPIVLPHTIRYQRSFGSHSLSCVTLTSKLILETWNPTATAYSTVQYSHFTKQGVFRYLFLYHPINRCPGWQIWAGRSSAIYAAVNPSGFRCRIFHNATFHNKFYINLL